MWKLAFEGEHLVYVYLINNIFKDLLITTVTKSMFLCNVYLDLKINLIICRYIEIINIQWTSLIKYHYLPVIFILHTNLITIYNLFFAFENSIIRVCLYLYESVNKSSFVDKTMLLIQYNTNHLITVVIGHSTWVWRRSECGALKRNTVISKNLFYSFYIKLKEDSFHLLQIIITSKDNIPFTNKDNLNKNFRGLSTNIP